VSSGSGETLNFSLKVKVIKNTNAKFLQNQNGHIKFPVYRGRKLAFVHFRNFGSKLFTPGGKKRMKILFVIVGAIAGLLIMRGFMFDGIEEMAWRFFWNDVFNGNLGTKGMDQVLQSATFMKSMVGVLGGGILGLLVGVKYTASKQQSNA